MTAIATHVSASRVGAMLGLSPHKSPLALFHELRGELPEQEDNEVLREGRYFEDAIAAIARDKFKLVVAAPSDSMIEMRDGPFIGHIDRTFLEGGRFGVLEIKQTFLGGGGQEWGESGSDVVPKHYWLQDLVYQGLLRATVKDAVLACPLADYGIVAARLHGGVQRFPIQWDAEVYAKLKSEAESFLARVRDNNPPDPKDEADMRRRWLVDDKKVVTGTPAVLGHIDALRELRKSLRDGEKAEKELVTLILGFAGDAGAIADENGQIRASLKADRKFDEAAFCAENPELVALFSRLDTTRLGKEQKVLYERYLRKPTNPVDQKRVVRLPEVKS